MLFVNKIIKNTWLTIYLLLAILCFSSCNILKIKTSCVKKEGDRRLVLRKIVLEKIKSEYKKTPETTIKRVVGSNCLDGSIEDSVKDSAKEFTLKVKVLNSKGIYDIFYFDNRLELKEVIHVLDEVY